MNKSAIANLRNELSVRGRNPVTPYFYPQPDFVSATNITGYISPFAFERFAHDIQSWREAIFEAEMYPYPMRVKMIRMYIDTMVNTYVKSVINRWKELTMLRDVYIYQNKGGKKVQSDVLTQAINEQEWFTQDYREYVLDAMLWGYSLIQLGDIVNDKFPDITFVKRQNIRPDGVDGKTPVVTGLVYGIDGIPIDSENKLVQMCNHWYPTKSNNGASLCGYGMLYETASIEIQMRHVNAWNVDYVESFGMPIKKGFTNKTGVQREAFEDFLFSSASNAAVLLDKNSGDDIVYETMKDAAASYMCYDNIEKRFKDVIAQFYLGHTDGMSSTAGKLGGQQAANKDGFNITIVEQAAQAKQIIAGDYVCRSINEIGAPLFRQLGEYVGSKTIKNLIPEGYKIGMLNDKEEYDIKRKQSMHRQNVAQYVKTLSDGGYDVDPKELGVILDGLTITAKPPETKVIRENTNINIDKNKTENE